MWLRSLLWHRFDLWPENFHMLQVKPKKKKKEKKERKKETKTVNEAENLGNFSARTRTPWSSLKPTRLPWKRLLTP